MLIRYFWKPIKYQMCIYMYTHIYVEQAVSVCKIYLKLCHEDLWILRWPRSFTYALDKSLHLLIVYDRSLQIMKCIFHRSKT